MFRYQQAYDEYMVSKLDSSRVNALLNQQIEYLTKKNAENEVLLEENHKKYDERLCKIRYNYTFPNLLIL